MVLDFQILGVYVDLKLVGFCTVLPILHASLVLVTRYECRDGTWRKLEAATEQGKLTGLSG